MATIQSRDELIKDMLSFADSIIKDKGYKYISNSTKHSCPICNPKSSTRGWSDIGFVSAILYHGGNIKNIQCSNSGVVQSAAWASYTNLTLDKWKKRNGSKWSLVSKQKSRLSSSILQKGDVILCYDGNNFKHITLYAGNGYIYDSSDKYKISKRKYSSLVYTPKIAFRPEYVKLVESSDVGESSKDYTNTYILDLYESKEYSEILPNSCEVEIINFLKTLKNKIDVEGQYKQTSKVIESVLREYNEAEREEFSIEMENFFYDLDDIIYTLYLESKNDIYISIIAEKLLKDFFSLDYMIELDSISDENTDNINNNETVDDIINKTIKNIADEIKANSADFPEPIAKLINSSSGSAFLNDFSNLNSIKDEYERQLQNKAFIKKYLNNIISNLKDDGIYKKSIVENSGNTNLYQYSYDLCLYRLALEIIIERSEFDRINIQETEAYLNDLSNVGGLRNFTQREFDLKNEEYNTSIEKIKFDKEQHIYDNYTTKLNANNIEVSQQKIQINKVNNQIMLIQDDYDIAKAEIKKIQDIYDGINNRIINFENANFSDEYSNWNKDIIGNPKTLNFWLDFIEGDSQLSQFNINLIGDRPKVVNDDNATSIYFKEVPQIIYTSNNEKNQIPFTGYKILNFGKNLNNYFSNVRSQYKSVKDVIDENLYTYGYCAEEVSIQLTPVYYLEPNQVIYLNDKESGLNGNYLINKISIPLGHSGNMTITASKIPSNLY